MQTRVSIPFLLIALFLYSFLLFPSSAAADQAQDKKQETREDKLKNCSRYRAKRKGVPVYEKPDKTSAVIYKLSQGELVCYIGEQQEFAILDWRQHALLNEKKSVRGKSMQGQEAAPELAFVSIVDLWPAKDLPQEFRTDDFMHRLKRYYYYMRSGGVPEDVLGPFRPYIDPFYSTPQCEAGKICDRIREEQDKKKSKK